jgi:hypothetical protein
MRESQGVTLNEKAQEQPKDKERAQTAQKTAPGHIPPQPDHGQGGRTAAIAGEEWILGRFVASDKRANSFGGSPVPKHGPLTAASSLLVAFAIDPRCIQE